jgi:RNA-directed DNA polymerase
MLEVRLGEKREVLRELANNATGQYSPFQREKKKKPFQRKPGKPKLRSIDNPSVKLKNVQRKILRRLLADLAIPDFLHGAAKGKTIRSNAEAHLRSNVVVRMDITNYFPNVTNDHVYRVWRDTLGCSPPIANLLTKLTTFQRHLPQGAPTSSALANIYLSSIYRPIEKRCIDADVEKTAYVDDLIFSGENSRLLMEPTRQLLAKEGLKLSARKREILGPRDVKIITGNRLGAGRVRAPRSKLKDIRAGIHKIKLGLIPANEMSKYVDSLRARIRHIASICAQDARSLQEKLDLHFDESHRSHGPRTELQP